MRSGVRSHTASRGARGYFPLTSLPERHQRVSQWLTQGAVAMTRAILARSGCCLAAGEQFGLARGASSS
jgi:hypothetical protein